MELRLVVAAERRAAVDLVELRPVVVVDEAGAVAGAPVAVLVWEGAAAARRDASRAAVSNRWAAPPQIATWARAPGEGWVKMNITK